MLCYYKVLKYVHTDNSHYFLYYIYILVYLQHCYTFLLHTGCVLTVLLLYCSYRYFPETISALPILILPGRKSEGKRPLERPRCRWIDNIKMDLSEIGLSVVD
jgi:hypothetical protein